MQLGMGSNPGKCIVHLRHGGILNSFQTSNPLVKSVEGEEKWQEPDHPHDALPQNWGETKSNPIVTCMVCSNLQLANPAIHRDEFHGPLFDTVRQVTLKTITH
ncbi:hypothetical protein TNCV_3435401 [Trichonephila clavipes]|nr:hypothetical protein TNCV_3435401 [Trichonephila clavipes]